MRISAYTSRLTRTGRHIDGGQLSRQPNGSSLLDDVGYLPLLTEYVDTHAKMSDVETEARAQIDKAQAAGIRLTHLDPHMGTIASTQDLLAVYVGLGNHYNLAGVARAEDR